MAVAVMTTMLAAFTVNVSAASAGYYKEAFAVEGDYTPHTSNSATVQTQWVDGAVKSTTTFGNTVNFNFHELDGKKNIILEFDLRVEDGSSPTPQVVTYFSVGSKHIPITASGLSWEIGVWYHVKAQILSDGTAITSMTATRTKEGGEPQNLSEQNARNNARAASIDFSAANPSYPDLVFTVDNLECFAGLSVADTTFKLGGTDIGSASEGQLSVTTNIKYGENDGIEDAQAFLVAFDASGMMIDCAVQEVDINPVGTNNGETAVTLTTVSTINVNDIAKTELYLWNSIAEQQPLIEAVSWVKP